MLEEIRGYSREMDMVSAKHVLVRGGTPVGPVGQT